VGYADGMKQRTVVRTYGRGSFLGLVSPLFAYIMAARGMHGWEDWSRRAMETDAVKMARRGYRVASTKEHALPGLGMASYTVTYELMDSSPPN
jgi:hypothetical protein